MQILRLQDLCLTEISDGTHKTPTYTEDKINGYKFLSSKDVTSGKIDWQHLKYIPTELHKELYARLAPKVGDILLAKNGTTGVAAIVDRDEVFDIYVSLALIRPDKSKVIPKYLLYAINSTPSKEFFNKNLKGIGVPNLHLKHIRETPIRVPSLFEQEHIIAVLDKVYDLIDQRKEQLKQLDDLVKSRFIELFGMPGSDTNGWGITTLGSVCQVNPKKGQDKRLVGDLEVSFVPMPAVSERGEIDPSEVRVYDTVKTGFTYFAENDVLFAKITPCMENGKGAVARGLHNSIGFGSTEFHVLRPLQGKTDPYWIYTLTSFSEFRSDAASNMTGSAGQRRVPANFLEQYRVSVPPIQLQEQFATFVEQTDKLKYCGDRGVAA